MDVAEESALPAVVWRELDTLVDELQQARVAVAAAQAQETALLARAVDLIETRAEERRALGVVFGSELPLREVSAELGTAMRVGDRTVQRRINDAHLLTTRFSATFEAWREGRIDRQHAATIVDEGCCLIDEAARAAYEGLVLAVAEVESAGRMREIARAIAARVDPEASARRRKAAVRGRGVRVVDLDDGMACLLADLPAPLAYAIMDRLTEFAGLVEVAERAERQGAAEGAEGLGVDGDVDAAEEPGSVEPPRTRGEIRADVLADVLLTATPTAHRGQSGDALIGVRGTINLTIPVTTAAGLDEEPALLSGYGPVDNNLARQIMCLTPSWNRVLIDMSTGAPVAVDRYRPSAELRRFIDTRDERCRFPGCTMKPWRCDADHTMDAALGGETSVCNLADLCRRHHVLKHVSPWYVKHVGGGRLEWTSPTGRVYNDYVPATLRFVPTLIHDGEHPPDYGGDPPPF